MVGAEGDRATLLPIQPHRNDACSRFELCQCFVREGKLRLAFLFTQEAYTSHLKASLHIPSF